MTFQDPELNRLAQQIVNRPPPGQPPPRVDPRAALARVLREQARRARRRLVQ